MRRPQFTLVVSCQPRSDEEFLQPERCTFRPPNATLSHRRLQHAAELAIGDGALDFWKALEQVFPETRIQRCTVHKTTNVLNKLPKSIQPQAKRMLHDIWKAPTKDEASKAFDLFEKTFAAKYEECVKCLKNDRDVLLTFFDFPAENWCHIRTTNPIESTFATIRLRHRKTKGNGSVKASLTMMFKLAQNASKGWRKLRGHQHIPDLIRGVKFIDRVNEHQSRMMTSNLHRHEQFKLKSSPEQLSLNTIFDSYSGSSERRRHP